MNVVKEIKRAMGRETPDEVVERIVTKDPPAAEEALAIAKRRSIDADPNVDVESLDLAVARGRVRVEALTAKLAEARAAIQAEQQAAIEAEAAQRRAEAAARFDECVRRVSKTAENFDRLLADAGAGGMALLNEIAALKKLDPGRVYYLDRSIDRIILPGLVVSGLQQCAPREIPGVRGAEKIPIAKSIGDLLKAKANGLTSDQPAIGAA